MKLKWLLVIEPQPYDTRKRRSPHCHERKDPRLTGESGEYSRPAMVNEKLDTNQKALQINVDAKRYGTFAEIGAGQEVARWFFRVGGAAKTVAKTISAYDMAVSDAIYGPTDRYVSRRRSKQCSIMNTTCCLNDWKKSAVLARLSLPLPIPLLPGARKGKAGWV
jgi:hypothetical protein